MFSSQLSLKQLRVVFQVALLLRASISGLFWGQWQYLPPEVVVGSGGLVERGNRCADVGVE